MVSNLGRFFYRLPQRVGVSVLVWILAPVAATAAPYTLTVRPIQVCQDNGTGCANAAKELYELETNKIWAQAEIEVKFRPWETYHETDFLVIGNFFELETLLFGGGHGEDTTSGVINMWFVNSIALGGTVYGAANVGGTQAIISDATFAAGRRDTIAHELGHNLGLGHYEDGAPDPLYDAVHNLMSSGGVRGVPGSIADIFPTGAGFDQLSPSQVAQAVELGIANDMLSTPEPSSLLLLGAGLVLTIRTIRRRQLS
jgi:hypothetical protein